MRYWDSSALIALHLEQQATAQVRDIYAKDPDVLTWTLSDVEVRSGIARLGRDGAIDQAGVQTAIARIESFWEMVHEIYLVEAVKPRAKRLPERRTRRHGPESSPARRGGHLRRR